MEWMPMKVIYLLWSDSDDEISDGFWKDTFAIQRRIALQFWSLIIRYLQQRPVWVTGSANTYRQLYHCTNLLMETVVYFKSTMVDLLCDWLAFRSSPMIGISFEYNLRRMCKNSVSACPVTYVVMWYRCNKVNSHSFIVKGDDMVCTWMM
jgi:hypothetical protein